MSAQFTFRRSLRVILYMGLADVALKYRGAIGGYFWSLGKIALRFVVIFGVFGRYVAEAIPLYPLYLFLGLIVWEYCTETISGCIAVVFQKKDLIQRVPMPRILLPLAMSWSNMLIFFSHLCIFCLLLFISSAPLSWGILYIGVVTVHIFLLCTGIGLLLSAFAVQYRDVPHIWQVFQQILFWLTPIFYPYRKQGVLFDEVVALPHRLKDISLEVLIDLIIRFQPFALLLHNVRRSLLYAREVGIPSVSHTIGLTCIVLGVFFIGAYVFSRRSRFFVEQY